MQNTIEIVDDNSLVAYHPESREGLPYKFNHCFDTPQKGCTWESIFNSIGVPLINAFIAGYNSCLISYGPSKTGKKEMLYGDNDSPGLIELAVQEVFSFIFNAPENISYTMLFSYWEMNNDTVIDLLDTKIELRDHHSEKKIRRNATDGVYISGLTEEVVQEKQDLERLIRDGTRRSQSLNMQRGTRWHAFIRLVLIREDEDHPETTIRSNLLFVNLKGADRVGRMGCHHTGDGKFNKEIDKERIKHGSSINRSLTALGNAIHNVVEYINKKVKDMDDEKQKLRLYGMFGDSKTTAVLSNVFCGNYCTVMIGSLSATGYHYLETMDALENLRVANLIPSKPVRGDLRTEAAILFEKITLFKQKHPKIPVINAPGVPLTEHQEAIKELESQYEHLVDGTQYTDLAEQIRTQKMQAQPPLMRMPDEGEPLWKHNEAKSRKHGSRATFYVPKKDKADKGKETFKGQWKLNEKSGYGIYENDRFIYEGEWKKNKRHGKNGTLWLKFRQQTEKKTTDWQAPSSQDKYELHRVYVGGWKSDKKHGQGVYYYQNGDIYDGEWAQGKRHGHGVMFYVDGTKFDGQWFNDKQDGQGCTTDLKTGDRHEGGYMNGMKHGPGVYYYISKGRMYKGEWFMDVAKCGEISEIPECDRLEVAQKSNVEQVPADSYPLPSIALKDADNVLESSILEILQQQDVISNNEY